MVPQRTRSRAKPARPNRSRQLLWLIGSVGGVIAVFGLGWFGGRQSASTNTAASVSDPTPTATLASTKLSGVTPTAPPDPTPHASNQTNAFATQVIDLTNAERRKAGCTDLTANPLLQESAQRHTQAMVDEDFFDHVQPDGATLTDRVAAVGYSYRWIGENIAVGQLAPAEVVTGWMNSEGHRQNILNCDFSEIGVGYVFDADDAGEINFQHYWTQNFGTPRN